MSIDRAQQWLLSHPHLIPALTVNQQEITRLLKDHHQADRVSKVAVRDPGLSLALLIKVNSRRGPESGRDIVESPLAAISLLGDDICHTLFREFALAEQILHQPHQLFLFQQLINRCLHNEVQAEMWAETLGFNKLELIRVAAVLAFSGEILCCVHDFENYMDYIRCGSLETEAERIFGFQFPELTDVLCQTLNLPLAIIQSLPHQLHDGQTSKLLFHTRQVSRFCETGWFDENTGNAFQQMADWLQMPIDKVVQKTHQYAVHAARTTFVPEAWQPAARLVLTRDQTWGLHLQPPADEQPASSPQQQPGAESEPAAPPPAGILEKIKQMLNQPETTQSALVNACLQGVFQDLKMSRVSLFMLTKDRKSLQNRMSLGVDESSPLRQFSIAIDQSGLLKALLSKPQAIWINQDTLNKYQQHLPASFLASIMTDNFLAMSLFIAQKPIGIIYADRSNTVDSITPDNYNQFKKLITLTSKALTLLSKR